MNNTKQSSPGEGKLSLKLVVIEIEPRPFFGHGHSGNHGGKRMLESKLLTFLWKRNCLKCGETNIAVFRHHVLLHGILSTKWFSQTEQNQLMSTPQEQNIDRENGCMLRIDIGLKAIKFYSFPQPLPASPPPHFYRVSPPPTAPPQFCCFPPPQPPHFHCFTPPPPPPPHLLFFPPRQSIKDCKLVS